MIFELLEKNEFRLFLILFFMIYGTEVGANLALAFQFLAVLVLLPQAIIQRILLRNGLVRTDDSHATVLNGQRQLLSGVLTIIVTVCAFLALLKATEFYWINSLQLFLQDKYLLLPSMIKYVYYLALLHIVYLTLNLICFTSDKLTKLFTYYSILIIGLLLIGRTDGYQDVLAHYSGVKVFALMGLLFVVKNEILKLVQNSKYTN